MTRFTSLVMIFTMNLLAAGCSSVVYPGPIEAMENTGDLIVRSYDGDKKIISAQWMTSDFSIEIQSLSAGDAVGLLIKTRGYTPGEKVTLLLDDKNTNDDGGSYNVVRKIIGVVDKHGEIRASFNIQGNSEKDFPVW